MVVVPARRIIYRLNAWRIKQTFPRFFFHHLNNKANIPSYLWFPFNFTDTDIYSANEMNKLTGKVTFIHYSLWISRLHNIELKLIRLILHWGTNIAVENITYFLSPKVPNRSITSLFLRVLNSCIPQLHLIGTKDSQNLEQLGQKKLWGTSLIL